MPHLIAGQQLYTFRVFCPITLRWTKSIEATSFEDAIEKAKKLGPQYKAPMVAIGLYHIYDDVE